MVEERIIAVGDQVLALGCGERAPGKGLLMRHHQPGQKLMLSTLAEPELQKVYARYVGQITALDLAERQLVEVASEYTDYIDDQLIWIPGLGLASLLDPAGFAKAVAWRKDAKL